MQEQQQAGKARMIGYAIGIALVVAVAGCGDWPSDESPIGSVSAPRS
ncbi:MAG TPA: hypothetical protein VK763_21385 [Terriglobales bacterium]|jgi:hypothetical protein|nr:hypothetical protein [Terriglobales bacterium]